MKKAFITVVVASILAISGSCAFSETAGTPNIEELLRLAPRISLAEKNISTFEIKGTLDIERIQLRFIVSGKQPDRHALRILDPRDGMPILVGAGNSFMFYDPVASEVLLGNAMPQFVFKMDPADHNVKIGFGVYLPEEDKEKKDVNKPEILLVDIRSLMASADQGVEIRKKEGNRFLVEGKTKRGGKIVAYVTPSRREGAYRRIELYKSDINATKPFLVLDKIVLNQPLPEERFAFSEKKLLASVPDIRRVSDHVTIKTAVSLGTFYQALVTRFVLADPGSQDLKPIVEKMVKHVIDWEQVKKKDTAIAPILKAIFQDLAVEPSKP
ncbi:MAG: hypothetical protein CVU61_11990 [Deltaproteobacteria bacterium HGW-Deltaproteobacteria-19]|jgi:hypothetical protein|nr:MAG: hypothetical protein CVU61_11990 [Deltaproteobacteria bacterium HGW-Deltaproteobacteria-19]